MKTFVRIIVLAFFVGGIALFVAYRSGEFGGTKEVIPFDPNGSVVVDNGGDSTSSDESKSISRSQADSLRRLRMMSSKTIIISDETWQMLDKDSLIPVKIDTIYEE